MRIERAQPRNGQRHGDCQETDSKGGFSHHRTAAAHPPGRIGPPLICVSALRAPMLRSSLPLPLRSKVKAGRVIGKQESPAWLANDSASAFAPSPPQNFFPLSLFCHTTRPGFIYLAGSMKALTIIPGQKNSASVVDMPDPPESDGSILARALDLGICGTDFELISAQYGWPPPGSDRLILGHESLGCVEEAPAACGFKKGDLIAGIVRHPDPEPCIACAIGEWDICRNGKYTERGIKERHGFGSEWWRVEPAFAVRLDPRLREVG